MRSERQEQIEELFDLALECSAEERDSFLRKSCGEDQALLATLVGLLRSDHKAGSFLGRLVTRPEEDEGPEPDFDRILSDQVAPGKLLGPYRLERKIGEGGMSTVFLAERVDGSFRRPVVVKLIRHGMESSETRRRLQQERQILANLEHPNIARLYDGGATEEHLPYFVMEFVEGTEVDEHCERLGLTVSQRLELFRKICDAVQYAHQNLVIHRDLKPGNILVTAKGEPKLLDFGIAKSLEPDPNTSTEEPTVAWARLMTPHYASPEQHLGQRITTASDVYSLGVVLYKLLTGQLPHRFEGYSAHQIESLLVTTPPEKPSEQIRGTRADSTSRQLVGDLDQIVLKALHPDLSQRYSSAAQLAEDLRRYQIGLPVLARPDTLSYRTSKFLRRHRVAASAAALTSVILVAAAIGLGLQSAQIARERDQLQAVVAFVKSVFTVAEEGEKLTVLQAVDSSTMRLDRELQDQPEVHATLLDVTGTIYLNLLEVKKARAQLKKAVDLRSAALGKNSLPYAESLSTLGIADALLDDYELGEQHAREALALYRTELGDLHPDLVRPLNNLVTVLCYKGEYAAAAEPSAEALSLAQNLLDEGQVDLADAISFGALAAAKQGDQAQAEALYREALRLHRHYRGEKHPKLTTILNNLALALKRQDKLGEAEDAYQQALDLQRELFGNDHAEVATTLNNLASLLRSQGSHEQAEETYREAIDLAREVFGPGHSAVLVTSTGLARVLIETGQAQAAEALLRSGLELWSENLKGSWLLAYTESVLGEALTQQRRYDEAHPLLVTSYRELRAALGEEAPRTRDARRRLDAFHKASGKTFPDFIPSP